MSEFTFLPVSYVNPDTKTRNRLRGGWIEEWEGGLKVYSKDNTIDPAGGLAMWGRGHQQCFCSQRQAGWYSRPQEGTH